MKNSKIVSKALSATKTIICIVLFFPLASLLNASESPQHNLQLHTYSAKYKAFHDEDEVGDASLELTRINNNEYKMVYQSKVSKFFLSDKRHEESLFTVQGNKLVPRNYEYKRTGTGRNKSLSVNFDAEKNKIFINNESKYDWNGELDNQLFRIDLSTQLANEVTNLEYDFINYRGEKRFYSLEVIGKESLNLPFGKLDAVKVRINRETNKRMTFAWFAPSLNWSLVRLQQFNEGKEQGDMQLASYSAN